MFSIKFLTDYLSVKETKILYLPHKHIQQTKKKLKLQKKFFSVLFHASVSLDQKKKINMSIYKVHYFNFRGRAEAIRWILKYSNVEFEDCRYELDEWPKVKNSKEIFIVKN